MIACLALGLVRYHFQILDFIPRDLNDQGWIVGERQSHDAEGVVKSAVLYRDGRTVSLGSFRRSGAAVSVNNRGHLLIACREDGKPKSLARRAKGGVRDLEILFWAKGKVTSLGSFSAAGRLLDSDRFLGHLGGITQVVQVTDGRPIRKALPAVPSRFPPQKCHSTYRDLSESGTVVGTTDFGGGLTHAFLMDRHGRVTDLYPEMGMHSGWWPLLINQAGDVVGYARDSSLGLGINFLWHQGKVTSLRLEGPYGLPARVASFNATQIVGDTDLFTAGSEVHELDNQDIDYGAKSYATTHAVLWERGQLLDLNGLTDAPKGFELLYASKINQKGWIVGAAIREGKRMGFLLTPTRRR